LPDSLGISRHYARYFAVFGDNSPLDLAANATFDLAANTNHDFFGKTRQISA
jgi:hypothetical protein